jgi:putative GTP pyrophosphokinase
MFKERDIKLALEDEGIPKYMEPIADRMSEFILLRNTYNSAIREISTKLENLDDEFKVRYDHTPIHHMERRLKSNKSLFEKMERKGFPVCLESVHEITDVAGVRVICNYIDDVYEVAELLMQQDDLRLIRRSDYIKNPKPSGYRSLHLVLEVPVFLSDRTEYVPVEVQFRTIAMDTWASLEHELKYKKSIANSRMIESELKRVADELASCDVPMQTIRDLIREDET